MRIATGFALIFLLSVAGPATADVSLEMPDARTVADEIRGEDDMDTVARKQAAMSILYDVLHKVSIERAQRGELSPGVPAKARTYRSIEEQAVASLDEKYRKKCSDWNFACPKDRLYTRKRSYEDSADFRRELLEKHLSAELMQSAAVTAFVAGGSWARPDAPERVRKPGIFHAEAQPLRFSGMVASFSLWWLLPALALFVYRAVDQDERKQAQGSSIAFTADGPVSIHHSFWYSTGRVIKGDTTIALMLAFFWSIAFPIAYAYWPVMLDGDAELWIWKILVPAALLGIAGALAVALVKGEAAAWRTLRLAWFGVLGLSILNLLGWLIALAVR